jgi:hypothetical protein
VHPADEPAERELVRDHLDRLVRLVRARLVVHREDHARDRLDEERGQGRRPERVEPAGVARDLAEEEVLDPADEARALLEPVDRVGDQLFDLLAARRFLTGHGGSPRSRLPRRGTARPPGRRCGSPARRARSA